MMTQRKMDNNLHRYLWTQFIEGNFQLQNLNPKDLSELYNFNIKQEDLDERAGNLRQLMVNFYITSQINDDSIDALKQFEKVKKFLSSGFDKSIYESMNKKALSSLIYTFEGEDGNHVKGVNFISDITLRIAVYFYFLSKYVE